MNKFIYSFGIIICIALIIPACEKQNELTEQKEENPALNPDEFMLRICHNTGNSYNIIEISDDAWPGHEAHGDVLYEEFPEVGVFKWVYAFGDSTVFRTMHITEVTETTFSGYGIDSEDGREWTLADGTINEDESFSFTIDYDDSDDYIDCEGAFICGEGLTGDFGTDGTGTITGQFYGHYTQEDDLIPIDP